MDGGKVQKDAAKLLNTKKKKNWHIRVDQDLTREQAEEPQKENQPDTE
jgi:hypothetical protein